MSSSGDNDNDDDDEDSVNPLDHIISLGFDGGEAMDALMQCNGNLEQTIEYLQQNNQKATTTITTTKKKNHENPSKKNKKKKQQAQPKHSPDKDDNDKKQPPYKSFKEQRKQELRFKKALRDSRKVCRVCGGSHPRNECPGIADDGRGHSRYRDHHARKEDNKQRKEFNRQWQQQKEFLQTGMWTQNILYYDGFANLFDAYEQQLFQKKKKNVRIDKDEDHSAIHENNEEDHYHEAAQMVRWFQEWATLTIELGDNHDSTKDIQTLLEQKKKELKTWSGPKLRETALSELAKKKEEDPKAVVDAALKHPNPRSELIKIILAVEEEEIHQHGDDSNDNDNDNNNVDALLIDRLPKRTLHNEWPGYRACICPFSVINKQEWMTNEVMTQLIQLNNVTDTGSSCATDTAVGTNTHPSSAVKILWAIPPQDICKWMVVDVGTMTTDAMTLLKTMDQKEQPSSTDDTVVVATVDVSFLAKLRADVKHMEMEYKAAMDRLLLASSSSSLQRTKKQPGGITTRESAEAEATQLRTLLMAKKSRKINSEELCNEIATKARLDVPAIQKLLETRIQTTVKTTTTATTTTSSTQEDVSSNNDGNNNRDNHSNSNNHHGKLVVGISCGLNYNTLEARDPLFGPIIRNAQRQACTMAMEVAIRNKLPIVLECQEAEEDKHMLLEEEPSLSSSSACSDLVHILVDTVPPDTQLLLRSGSLTVAPKPGVEKLIETYPHLYIGLSGTSTYTKCPKQLLNVIFDTPLEKMVVTSESPTWLPSQLNKEDMSHQFIPICLPPHTACIAETIAERKHHRVSREQVLEISSKNLSTLFGMPPLAR